MSEESALRWQCRRGMRELDILLERYLERKHITSSEAEKVLFRQFLNLSDPQLAAYLLRGEKSAEKATQSLVEQILGASAT